MGLMDIFEAMSSWIGFDVNERGTIGLPALASRDGDPGSDETPMMFGDKFVD